MAHLQKYITILKTIRFHNDHAGEVLNTTIPTAPVGYKLQGIWPFLPVPVILESIEERLFSAALKTKCVHCTKMMKQNFLSG